MANQHPRLELNTVFSTVELAHSIQVQTSQPPSCHSALRAGFAGYTDNPRWTPQKRRAWKQGKQWRSELAAGLIEVKDGFLMTSEALAQAAATGGIDQSESKPKLLQSLLSWSRKKPAIN